MYSGSRGGPRRKGGPVDSCAPNASASQAPAARHAAGAAIDASPSSPQSADPAKRARRPLSSRVLRWRRVAIGVVLGVLVAAALRPFFQEAPHALTQKDIDRAVARTLQTLNPPSPAVRAWEIVRPSVVRVRGFSKATAGQTEYGVGTGVVVVDNGTILTNLHVVEHADRIVVEFDDGLETEATVVSVQQHNDLAVLRAADIPDDLVAATLRSTGDLAPGARVVVVGFPFGIGPSLSAGVVSGLGREYKSPDGDRLTNLIQFDAAANPGNSGGPLITDEGEVVGIVTAILNPGKQGVFIGIGFAVPIENAASGFGMPPF